MSRVRPFTLITGISILISLTPFNSVAAGPAITTTTQVVNTILNGKNPPISSIGKNGDFYVDVRNLMFYGPKKNGLWPLGISLKGLDGKNGTDGKNGADGATITKTVTGEKGAKGDTGATGPQGPKGDTGATGLTGAMGPTGATGLTGATGPAGAKGETGATGGQGPIGLTGPKGDKGATGEQGLAGPSRSFHGSVSFSNSVSGTSSSSANSNAFGNFEAGKSYLVRLVLVGIYSLNEDFEWRLSVNPAGAAANVSTSYSMSHVRSFRSNVSTKEINFHADILIDGSNSANAFNLIATVQHDVTGYGTVSMSGTFVATQVGSAS